MLLTMNADPRLIPNSALTLADVPDLDIPALDSASFHMGGNGTSSREWDVLWMFGLTFDGAAFFGGDPAASERLAAFSDSIKAAFEAGGKLPRIDLALLRACLYIEQRRTKWGFRWWSVGALPTRLRRILGRAAPRDPLRNLLEPLLPG